MNDKYSKLIRLANILTDSNTFDFVLNTTKANVQNMLVEIYDLFKDKISRKQGMITKSLMGKSVDYGVRSVISAPRFHANSYKDMPIDFNHAGVPLSQCCVTFFPYIAEWIRRFFSQSFEQSGKKFPIRDKNTGDISFMEIDEPEAFFTNDYIKKQIDNFVHAPSDRFKLLEVPVVGRKEPMHMVFTGKHYSKYDTTTVSPLASRYATWTDLLYQAAYDVTKNKTVYITRYPVTGYFNTFPTYITVLSTHKTIPIYINDTVYERYPYIDLNLSPDDVAISFIDTVSTSNLKLKGMGADYDGDQISVKGVFSQEANLEGEKIMNSKFFILDTTGKNTRTTENEAIQTLYAMTKF